MRQVEFDIDLVEKIVAEEDGDIAVEIVLAGDQRSPVLADSFTDPELVDMNVFGAGLATDAEGAIAFGLISGQPQLRGCRAPHEAHLRPGVEQDADLLAVDLAVDDGPVVFRSNWPFRDPCQLALRGLGSGVACHGEADRSEKSARFRQPPCRKGDSPSLYSCTPCVTTLTRSRSAAV